MNVQVSDLGKYDAPEICSVYSEKVEEGTAVKQGLGYFRGDQALMGHRILQKWSVGSSGKSVAPVLGPGADPRGGDPEKVRHVCLTGVLLRT